METEQDVLPGERMQVPSDDWRNLIQASKREEEVVALVRDHMARWTPQEISRLPQDCRPHRIRDAEDVAQWAFELATTHCAQSVPLEDEPLLDRMLVFVTHAAVRLSELKAEAPDLE